MVTLHTVALILHIIAGFTALLTGTAILFIRKGGTVHRRAGLAFFISLMAVSFSSFLLSVVHPNPFLFMIGAFTLYQGLSGYRAVKVRLRTTGVRDLLITLLGAVDAVAMCISGQVVLMVFGGISAFLVVGDVRVHALTLRRQPVPRHTWLQRHIGHMMGSYIATFTAFLVVNFSSSPLGVWVWFMPSVAFVPLILIWTRHYTKRPPRGIGMRGAAVLAFLGLGTAAIAQPYVQGGNTRHRFAQCIIGSDALFLPGNGTRTWEADKAGEWSASSMPTTGALRAVIGGIHFWGHADFRISFPIAHTGNSGLRTGAAVDARMFPWRIENGHVRPYLGFSFVQVSYRMAGGPDLVEYRLPLGVGAVYAWKNTLFQIGGAYDLGESRDYPTSQGKLLPVQTPRQWLAFGIARMIDLTLSSEPGWRSGRTKALTDTLSSLGKLNAITLSFGVSTAFTLGRAGMASRSSPRLTGHKVSQVYPEFGAGYYLDKADLHFGLTYRRIVDRVQGYGDSHTLDRQAFTLETVKFIADYHGFVPFVGPAISYDRIKVKDVRDGAYLDGASWKGVRPGVTAGWDIRPDRLQVFLLRTALRWFPGSWISQAHGRYRLQDQLEVDFIQLVIMPGRL